MPLKFAPISHSSYAHRIAINYNYTFVLHNSFPNHLKANGVGNLQVNLISLMEAEAIYFLTSNVTVTDTEYAQEICSLITESNGNSCIKRH